MGETLCWVIAQCLNCSFTECSQDPKTPRTVIVGNVLSQELLVGRRRTALCEPNLVRLRFRFLRSLNCLPLGLQRLAGVTEFF